MTDLIKNLVEVFGEPESYHIKEDITFMCPFCKHPRPHLVINVKKFVAHCWSCNEKGNIYSILRKAGRADVAKRIRKEIAGDIDNVFDNKKEVVKKPYIPDNYKNLYHKQKSKLYSAAYNYVVSRNVKQENVMKYNIHYNILNERILIPSYDKNFNLNYYITRSIRKNNSYINFEQDKTKIIFNEWNIDWSKRLYIVEGIFDYMVLDSNAVPLLGSTLNTKSRLFKMIIKNETDVAICLDPDAEDKALKMSDDFYNYGIKVSYVDWINIKEDIADLGNKAFEAVEHNLIEYDITTRVKKELNGHSTNSSHRRSSFTSLQEAY